MSCPTAKGNRRQHCALKLQVFLKKRGFAVKIDGKVSNAMRTAIQNCFGVDKCVAQIYRQI